MSGSESLLNVSCSKSIQLNGAVGQCHPLKNIPKNLNKNYSDEKVLGFGKTLSEEAVNDIIKQVDANGDGEISFEEFA